MPAGDSPEQASGGELKLRGFALFLAFASSFVLFSLFIPWVNPQDKMEAGAYNAYTESLILDRDFNAIKRLPPHIAWYASPTGNYTETFSTGIAVFWLPFFLYAHGVEAAAGAAGFAGYAPTDIAQLIASIFFTWALLMLSCKFCSRYFPEKLAKAVTVSAFFGTGLFYYFIALPTNNDITTAFVAALLLVYSVYLSGEPTKTRDWLLAGLLCGLLLAIKGTGSLFLLVAGFLAVSADRAGSGKKWPRTLWFLGGFGVIFLLCEYNIYLQLGTLQEWKSIIFHPLFLSNILPSLLFGARGYFITSPLYLIPFVFLLYWIGRFIGGTSLQKAPLAAVFACFCGIKVLGVSFRFFHNEYFGARILLAEFFMYVFVICAALTGLPGRTALRSVRWPTAVLLFSLGGWTFLQALHKNANGFYLHEQGLRSLPWIYASWKNVFQQFLGACPARDYHRILYYLPLVSGLSAILVGLAELRDVFSRKVIRSISLYTGICGIVYLGATLLNGMNNAAHVRNLRAEGFYQGRAIVKGPYSFGYENFLSEVNMEILFAREKRDVNAERRYLKLKADYLRLIEPEILSDPKGVFRRPIEEAVSFWDKDDYLGEDSFQFHQHALNANCGGR